MKDNQLSLRQKLDALAAEGKEIKITWEGGSDSGGYSLFVDGQQGGYGDDIDIMSDDVIDIISDSIGYGSWDGDFSADGEVIYNADEGAFIGEGKDTESEYGSLVDIAIEIKIPRVLNFDTFEINTEGTFCWDEFVATCTFSINNGPVFPEHTMVEDNMETYLRELITHILETDESCKDEEIGWVGNEYSIPREFFTEDGDDLVYVIDSLDFSYNNTKHQSYHITINEEQ